MNYALRILSYILLAVALMVCLVMAVSRVGWEQSNSNLMSIVNGNDQLSLSQLADLGITAVAVHASILATGAGVSPQSIRNVGLGVVLIVDAAVSPRISESGPFLAWWTQGRVSPDDPVVIWLTQNNVPMIAREFAPLDLIQTLWVNGYRNVVRGHEIPDADLRAASLATLVSRWERAVRERGIRALILTPIPGDTPAQSTGYYKEVLSNLTAAGYHTGEPPILPPIYNPTFVIFLHIGLCALLLLILLRLIPSLPMAALLLAGAGASLSLGFDAPLLCQIDALLVTILAPIFGVLFLLPPTGTGWRAGVRLILMFTGVSLLGALLLSAFLSQPVFILKVASFRGVKISLLLPPSLALILAYREKWRDLLRTPFKNGHALFGSIFLAAGVGLIVFIVLRSGNADSLVSGTEARTRALLETIFYARPRFKEFLLGHPFLLLFGASGGLGAWALRYRPALLFFGLIGQVSVLNTFAHAHTPLLFSLLRTANGLFLGLLFGTGLYLVLLLVKKGRRRMHQRT
jgi:hypothetical protein